MLKKVLIITLVILILAPMVFAQDQPGFNELVTALGLLVSALAALLASAITNLIKTIPYLGNKDKDNIATAVTQVIAVVVGLITGYLGAWLAAGLNLVPDTQLQTLVITVATPVINEILFRLKKLAPAA